jgi:hypothetical protein
MGETAGRMEIDTGLAVPFFLNTSTLRSTAPSRTAG